MTNYEWLVKNKAELVKDILRCHLSKEKGIPDRCSETYCRDCDFSCGDCTARSKEWLEQKHEPLYKKGDIVIGPFDQIFIVKEYRSDDGDIKVSRYVDGLSGGQVIPITEIKKKVGHIDESEKTDDPSLCASCKSKECILHTGIVRRHCYFYKAESEV